MIRLPSLCMRLAASLAVLAMAAVFARPVLACEMASAATKIIDAADAIAGRAEHAPQSGHAEHQMPAVPASSDPAERDASNPVACDHLVGCAGMVLGPAIEIDVASAPVERLLPSAPASPVDAPARALDPPPPKA